MRNKDIIDSWCTSNSHDPWIAHDMCPTDSETEISIIRRSNRHGFQSWGWSDPLNKIILSDHKLNRAQRKLIWKHAKLIANALNKAD
jgi:hypothetical protein